MSNFPFSQGVFKKLLLQTRKNQGLFGKGLIFAVSVFWCNCHEGHLSVHIIVLQNLKILVSDLENSILKFKKVKSGSRFQRYFMRLRALGNSSIEKRGLFVVGKISY